MYSRFLAEFRPDSLPLEAEARRAIFETKVRSMIAHNSNPSSTWRRGIKAYSDLTHQEFRDYYHLVGANQECSATYHPADNETNYSSILKDMPTSWDWRDYNAVTPVKDQGDCGSCWTFSTVGTLEARYLMKYGTPKYFSEQ